MNVIATKENYRNYNFKAGANIQVEGKPVISGTGVVLQSFVPATVTTAGAETYTAAELVGGMILRDPNGGAVTDTFPTAALLVALLNPGVNTGFDFALRNTANAAETITVQAGAGGTLSGVATIDQNNTKEFRVVFTNVSPGAETYTVFSLGTRVT